MRREPLDATVAIPSSSPGLVSDVQRVRVIVTGTRDDTDTDLALAVEARLAALPVDATVISGGASGVDRWAISFARRLSLGVEIHPASWEAFGKAAGPLRNQEMVDAGADLVLAFPGGKGTADLVSRARKAGIPVEWIEP